MIKVRKKVRARISYKKGTLQWQNTEKNQKK
jgi:hypothetical protein